MTKARPFSIGCIVSNRSEVVKMAPLILKLEESAWAEVHLITVWKHRSLLTEGLALFNLHPEFNLNLRSINQNYHNFKEVLYKQLDLLIRKQHFNLLLAAGDSPVVFFSALIASQQQLPFAHIDAGIRNSETKEINPKEVNAVLTDSISTWHFVPTNQEKENLVHENIPEDAIFVTGDTNVDALQWILKNVPDRNRYNYPQNLIILSLNHQAHFKMNLTKICLAIKVLAKNFDDLSFVFTAQPNAKKQEVLNKLIVNQPKIHLLPKLKFDEFIHLMQRAILILTDSEAIQEEASALHKPVLILKNFTQRPALIKEGVGFLVGTSTKKIINSVSELITNGQRYLKITRYSPPYGDGHAAERITKVLKRTAMTKKKPFLDGFGIKNG